MQDHVSSSDTFTLIKKCRLCSSEVLFDVLDLGDQPPANSLKAMQSQSEMMVPLELVQCQNCSAVQLTATIDPQYLFNEYVWVTGTSSTAKNYSQFYCDEVLKRCSVNKPFVVEVASNDGTFLKKFMERGCEVLGVDPAQNIAQLANKNSIPTCADFFTTELADDLLKKKSKANIVMARNVIPHVKAIHSIVSGMAKLVEEEGLVVIEFHYAKKIVEELHYDSIYHEHLFYFSIKSLSKLFEQYGLHPFDVFSSPISGGSLVLFFSKQKQSPTAALLKLIQEETLSQLNNYEIWRDFGKKSISHANSLKAVVEQYVSVAPLVAYGASARSSTLLNFCKITNKEVEFVIDQNQMKHGLFTPGTSIPIISFEDGVKRLEGKNLLLLAWNFEDEIVSDLRSAGYNGVIIVPLPGEVRTR